MNTEQGLAIKQLTLLLAALQFKFYAEIHAAKGTPEGDKKAAENRRFQAACVDAYEA